jgi:hypothetical protein
MRIDANVDKTKKISKNDRIFCQTSQTDDRNHKTTLFVRVLQGNRIYLNPKLKPIGKN